MLTHEKLYRLNKNSRDLIELVSPDVASSNIELFCRKSNMQSKFSNELQNRGIDKMIDEKYTELEDVLEKIQNEITLLLQINKSVKKTKLDLDIAKIFHQNLVLPRRIIIDYKFWRYITLFHFIELVKWRWENKPNEPSYWYANAKDICGRATGLTLNKEKYDEDKSVVYNSRNQRITCYRYWWIGNKLYDPKKRYYYLDKISEKLKTEDASVQDFLNHLEGNRLLSENDRISKILANAILLSNKKFTEQEARDCFNRYNAFSNRLFMDAEERIIKREICLLNS